MILDSPRLAIAGLSGDSGKTLVAIGLVRALRDRGVAVGPLKKGPDYIDAAWLGAAAGRPGRNLDTFLQDRAALGEVLRRAAEDADVLVIEGNRGLHDGFDAQGSHSTAELSKQVGAPVVLVLDVTKMTRTAAALVAGCALLDEDVTLAGVILNRVATERQERVVREAIDRETRIPVLGAIPRLRDTDPLPGRHLGLVTAAEHPDAEAAIDRAAALVAEHVDLDELRAVAERAPEARFPDHAGVDAAQPVRIGVFRDAAFSFYYPENLELLTEAGAELVEVSPLADRSLPPVDGLYLGGGFPEVHAEALAANASLRSAVAEAAASGLPIYAECGGLIYLARELRSDAGAWPMSGVLDLVVEQSPRPQGHGYMRARVEQENPFFPVGTRLSGHEFHYTRVVGGDDAARGVLAVERGHGIQGRRDGVVRGRVWASYLHLHALGATAWCDGFLGACRGLRPARTGG